MMQSHDIKLKNVMILIVYSYQRYTIRTGPKMGNTVATPENSVADVPAMTASEPQRNDATPKIATMVASVLPSHVFEPGVSPQKNNKNNKNKKITNIDSVIRVTTESIKEHCVSSFLLMMDPVLQYVLKKSWSSWSSVADQSDYVSNIRFYVEQIIPVYRSQYILWFSATTLSLIMDNEDGEEKEDPETNTKVRTVLNKIHATVCESMVTEFFALFVDTIYKCKKLSRDGAEQLHLDTTELRSCFIQMPHHGLTDSDIVPVTSYVQVLDRELNKVYSLLKLVIAPKDIFVDIYLQLCRSTSSTMKTDVTGTHEELYKIMELKGLSNEEQDLIIVRYSKIVNVAKGFQQPLTYRQKPLDEEEYMGNNRRPSFEGTRSSFERRPSFERLSFDDDRNSSHVKNKEQRRSSIDTVGAGAKLKAVYGL